MTLQKLEMPAQPIESKFYRFQVFQGKQERDGSLSRNKTVGMAYLKSGQETYYTLRLWTFIQERFYLLQTKTDPTRYLVMTREPNKSLGARNKHFWNIVGNAQVDTRLGHMQINFDLLPGPIYMSLFPEPVAKITSLPGPESFMEAA